jgi:YD repeat-containing protein
VFYNYDSCANGVGKLCSITDTSGTTAYSYQLDSQLTSQTVTINGTGTLAQKATYSTSWTYDVADRMASITYPDGNKVSYAYDDASHVYSAYVTSAVLGTQQQFAYDISYTAFGAPSMLSLMAN